MRLAAIAIGLIVASSVPAFAYTQQDQNDCMSDAFRLCSAAIPDANRVASCLYSKRQQLSPSCAGAFARYTRTGAHRHSRQSVVSTTD